MSVHRLEGGTDKHCRKWRIRYRVKLPDGSYSCRSDTFEGTKREAEAREEFLKSAAKLSKQTVPRGKLSSVAKSWAERRLSSGVVTDVTVSKNIGHVKRLVKEMGDRDVSKITARLLSSTYSSMDAAPEYVHNINATLRTMFRDIGIEPNPCDGVELPKVRRKERALVDAEGLKDVSRVCRSGAPCSFAVALCAQTGMRRGEVCALRVMDIDFRCRVIHVMGAIDKFGKRKGTKNDTFRELPLTEGAERTVIAAINDAKSRGIRMDKSTPLIPSDDGGWIDPHAVTRWWTRNRGKLGFEGVQLHSLRHSYLSELARRGVPVKTLQAIAGHSQASTTMQIYAHANLDDKRAATESVDW